MRFIDFLISGSIVFSLLPSTGLVSYARKNWKFDAHGFGAGFLCRFGLACLGVSGVSMGTGCPSEMFYDGRRIGWNLNWWSMLIDLSLN